MGIIGGVIGYQILRRISKNGNGGHMDGSAYGGKSKVEELLGPDFWIEIQGKTVIDFGCGEGAEAIEIARRGARRVIGVDIQERLLEVARMSAADAGVADRCIFTTRPTEPADIIVAIDSFEHFDDPLSVLRTMSNMLNSAGSIIAAFGPTWYHPYGGHLFSVFPWAHLLFTEKALVRWRSDFKNDGATCFREVEGGLNRMTIGRFEHIVEQSPFKFAHMESVPIKKFQPFANHFTREFTTSIIRCKLVRRD
jgi:SAM-dependent methyltransferase